MTSKGISPKKKPGWIMRWSLVALVTLYLFTAWATHGNYQAARAFVRTAPYLWALYLVVVCVRLVILFGKDHPVQTTLAVAAIALFGASYFVEGWLAPASFALVTVLVITSARAPICKIFAESYRRIAETTRQL